jgi:gamma-glutamyltranspeptidase/glutathione hydrolase
MQRAYVDRARYMGDPDWVKIPLKKLISKSYAAKTRAMIDPVHAMSAEAVARQMPILPVPPEHTETTHFSIMDKEGNVVVSTQTINGWFGSKLMPSGTGILLNNEMDDFSAKPGASNLFGAIGSKANSVQPGKTPLSSMSPTIVLEGGKPRLALGAPGGTRIITCVAQTILNALVYHLPLYESVNALRIHQQWRPDVLNIEAPGFGEATERDLKARGWKIVKGSADCAVMAVAREGDLLRGVSEPRDNGKAFAR